MHVVWVWYNRDRLSKVKGIHKSTAYARDGYDHIS